MPANTIYTREQERVVDGNLETKSHFYQWCDVDLGRMVPVNEVIVYADYHPHTFVVRVGKVAKDIDIYLFCSQLTRKRRKYIYTNHSFHERFKLEDFSFLFSCKPW